MRISAICDIKVHRTSLCLHHSLVFPIETPLISVTLQIVDSDGGEVDALTT